MAKAKASLEEGLNNSANKRGFTGKERHRYIGGALYNMGKAKTRSGKREGPKPTAHKAEAPKPAPKPREVTRSREVKRGMKPEPGRTKIKTPKRYRMPRSTPKPRERLELTVKVNKKASDAVPNKAYLLYGVYNVKTGAQVGGNYRKRAAALAEAKIAMDAHNHPKGKHGRGMLV